MPNNMIAHVVVGTCESQELVDNNVSLSDFRQQVTQFGNELLD